MCASFASIWALVFADLRRTSLAAKSDRKYSATRDVATINVRIEFERAFEEGGEEEDDDEDNEGEDEDEENSKGLA